MSTMTHTTTTRRIAGAEWTKLRTLPSTWRTAALSTVMAIGFEVAVAYSEASQWHTITAQQRQASSSAGWRQYMPGIATQATVTVHRSAGLLSPALALAGYAAIALVAASLRASYRDA